MTLVVGVVQEDSNYNDADAFEANVQTGTILHFLSSPGVFLSLIMNHRHFL